MRNTNIKPPAELPHVPLPPAPSAARPSDGLDMARSEARRYLPNLVRLLAAMALSPDSEAPLHTRWLCANRLADIAGVLPQQVPTMIAPVPLSLANSVDGGDDAQQ